MPHKINVPHHSFIMYANISEKKIISHPDMHT